MSLQLPVPLMGAPGSPYTRKMLAVLRYRRIPYRLLISNSQAAAAMPQTRVRLLPTFYFPGEDGALEAVTDSTPIIRRLEREAQGRSVIPEDPALRFLDELIEDYADEWLTKAMFHYRWSFPADIDKASRVLPCWADPSVSDEALQARARTIGERQISRLYVVGSNAVTAPVIEASYRRFLGVFERLLSQRPFTLGRRPASCDFAIFGQLTQLTAFDPTPAALATELAPRVTAWVGSVEDCSGVEPDAAPWATFEEAASSLGDLLAEIGRTYVPVMLANARALDNGAAEVEAEVDGLPWRQPPFAYQAKCLRWLRVSHGELPAAERRRVDDILAAAGVDALFA
jgi:glutathione S-transferase